MIASIGSLAAGHLEAGAGDLEAGGWKLGAPGWSPCQKQGWCWGLGLLLGLGLRLGKYAEV